MPFFNLPADLQALIDGEIDYIDDPAFDKAHDDALEKIVVPTRESVQQLLAA